MADPELFRHFHESSFSAVEGGVHRFLDPAKDKLVGSFLQVKLGLYVSEVPRSSLIYVRQDLEDLYNSLLSDIDDDELTRTVYIGNPGTGKSLTAIQLLFLLIKLHSASPVVYYSEKLSRKVYYLFKDGKFDTVLDLKDATGYLSRPETFYIHDGSKIPDSGSVAARTVLVTSPEPSVYKEFAKASGGYNAFYGRLWSEEELRACWEYAYSRIPWQTVVKHAYMAGPIPRLVFQSAKKFETVANILKSKLAHTTDLLSVFSSIGKHDLKQSFSHLLLHLDRGKLHLDRGKVPWQGYKKIASQFVMEQLLLRLDKEKWLEMIHKLQGVGALASFRGTVMELLMHITFPRFLGKCERICEVRTGTNVHQHSAASARLNVDEAEDLKVIFYVDFEDLQAKIENCIAERCAGAYFWPRIKSEAAIDSIYIDFKRKRAYLLQATVSKKHAVVWHPVKLLMQFLSSNNIRIAGLYFVLSATNFSAFKAQSWRVTRKLKGDYPDLVSIPSLCQYKVEFSVFDDDWQNIECLSDTLQEMDENFKLTLSREMDLPEEHVRGKRRRAADESSSSSALMIGELDITEVDVAPGHAYEQVYASTS